MKVSLIAHTPNAEKLVAASAKLCYSSSTLDDIVEKLDEDDVRDFILKIVEMGHETPLEHVSFTFSVERVSRSLLAQLTRHRIASYSVQSQRYVKIQEMRYVIPPEIEKIPEAKLEFLEAMESAKNHYDKLTKILKEKYDLGVENNSKNESPEKKAIEDARYVLPNACCTSLICTINARSLLNFFANRCCFRAQWEIRQLAFEMLKLVKRVAPTLFQMAGPLCLSRGCPEARFSCGRSNEVKEIFKNLN